MNETAGQTLELRHYGTAMLIRCVEERLLALFSAGKLSGTVHTCIGQEFSGVAVAEALRPGDQVVSNHRCHGHFLAWTDDVEGLLAEVMGKDTGVCGGRGGSQHLYASGFFSNGVQGGIVPVAAGLALAHRIQGQGRVGVVFIGDGTLGEGVLYESLNLAAKWQLPLLVVLENNLYAQSTAQAQTLAGEICARAEAFGIRTWKSSTWDPWQLMATAAACATHVRESLEPAFLQVDTYRLEGHSKGDDERDPLEVREYWGRDPLKLFCERSPKDAEKMRAQAEKRVDGALSRAEGAQFAVDRQDAASKLQGEPRRWLPTIVESEERLVTRIRASLEDNMRKNERIILIGQDIEAPYGGAFKVTKGLSEAFPGRVRNTPISEAAMVGMGCGAAMNGLLPICEIMFGDFLTLAADQIINHAAKFRYMYNDQVTVPVVVRTPMGGKRGYGPTHSQSIEKHFLGLPGTSVLALHSRFDPKSVYDALLDHIDQPTIVIENKLLYGVKLSATMEAGFFLEHTDERFPITRIRPDADPDVTVLCYGGMLPDVEAAVVRAFSELEVVAEIICPIRLYPFDAWAIVESVRSSGRLLIVEEGQGFAAFGAEVISQIVESEPGLLIRVRRLGARSHPIPASGPLEKEALPNPRSILSAIQETAQGG